MKNQRILFFVSRILTVLYICLVTLFAADSFQTPFSILALCIHLIPTLILLAIAWVAWRREFLGGLIFIGLGIIGSIFSFNNGTSILFIFTILAPEFIIGLLFLLQTTRKTIWWRETLYAVGTILLLWLDTAAFHDINMHEPNLVNEYIVLAISAGLFIMAISLEWRRRNG